MAPLQTFQKFSPKKNLPTYLQQNRLRVSVLVVGGAIYLFKFTLELRNLNIIYQVCFEGKVLIIHHEFSNVLKSMWCICQINIQLLCFLYRG